MSTPFNVRRMASEAGIQTTGGFAVIAECVTQDELERFAHIAISAATKTLATANYENQCELEGRIEELEKQRDQLLEALELADAMLAGANMNADVVEKKVKAAIAAVKGNQQ